MRAAYFALHFNVFADEQLDDGSDLIGRGQRLKVLVDFRQRLGVGTAEIDMLDQQCPDGEHLAIQFLSHLLQALGQRVVVLLLAAPRCS